MIILYYASVDFYSKPNPSYHLMTTMLEDILKAGHSVHLVGCKEKGLEKHIPDNLAANAQFSYELAEVKPVKKSHFVRRYLSGIMYAVKTRKFIKKQKNKADIIFVQSSPTVLYNIRNARKYAGRAKVIYNIQDMFPGSSIASGVMKRRWMQKVFFALQKCAYKKADVITVISEDMKRKVEEQGVLSDKIKVIVNWFDNTSVQYIEWEENRFVKKNELDKQKFYVQYAGTMGYVFDYEMVLNVAKLLQEYADIEFQMIGAGSQKQDFMSRAEELKLDNIKFLPLEPQEMVSDVYSACSVCFIPLKKGVIGNSVPSKAGLLMACKKPIVSSVDENSDYFNMINENKFGYAVGTDKPEDAAGALLKLYQDRELCKEYGENGYKYGHDLYSRDKNMKEYLDLFCELAEKR